MNYDDGFSTCGETDVPNDLDGDGEYDYVVDEAMIGGDENVADDDTDGLGGDENVADGDNAGNDTNEMGGDEI